MNKEIEELLNTLKKEDDYWSKRKHDYPFPDYYSLNREDLHLLLSYIEKLEKIIYKARKMIFDNYGVLDKYEIEMLDDILKGGSE